MPVRYYLLVAWGVLLVACASGTSQLNPSPGHGQPDAAITAHFSLPSPQSVLHSATATGGQHCDGAEYDPASCARVDPTGTAATFTPNWDPAVPAFADVAYAVFNFTVAAGIEQVTVEPHWVSAPEYWIGIGNAVHNHWDWYGQPVGDSLPLTLADYRFSGTSVLVALVALGSTPAQLDAMDLESSSIGPLRKMFFLHHSTGWGIVSEGDVRGYIDNYNSAHSEHFEFWDQGYNGDGPRDQDGNINGTLYDVPGDNTDVEGLWYLWTSTEADATACRNGFLADYEVIAFKSCFPNSAIYDDERLNQYKTWYLEIRDALDAHPEKLFIVMSTPPLVPEDTNPEEAARARNFANWLKSGTYLSGHPNIVCFDLFDALAAPDTAETEANMLRPEYRLAEPHNSHPNPVGNAAVGPVFAQFFIDSALAYSPPG
jgi:hypothetical protein